MIVQMKMMKLILKKNYNNLFKNILIKIFKKSKLYKNYMKKIKNIYLLYN